MERRARIEAAGKRDADFFAGWKTLKDVQNYQRFTADLLAHAQASMKSGQTSESAAAAFNVDKYPGYKKERVQGSIQAVYDELKK